MSKITLAICFLLLAAGPATALAALTPAGGSSGNEVTPQMERTADSTAGAQCPPNEEPRIEFPDAILFVCPGDTTCLEISVTDPDDGDSVTLSLLDGPIDYTTRTEEAPLVDTICFPVDTAGLYYFIWQAEDLKGAVDIDTTFFEVEVNTPPTLVVPPDQELFVCLADSLCIDGISASDPDTVGPLTLQMIEGAGHFNAELGQLCFLPGDSGGTYTFVFSACDGCLCVEDTLRVTVSTNRSPFIDVPAPPEPIACVPEGGQVCTEGWVIGDPDGDWLVTNTMGSGTFDAETGTFCSPVGAPGQYTQTLIVSDSCGLTVKKTLTFEILPNQPPYVELPADDSVYFCTADILCVPYSAGDAEDGDPLLTTNLGILGDTEICFEVDTSGRYTLIVTATDVCGEVRADTAVFDVQLNRPPFVEAPDTVSLAICEGESTACLLEPILLGDPDFDDSVVVTLPAGVTLDETGILCISDAVTGTYEIEIGLTDDCGLSAYDTVVAVVSVGGLPTLSFSVPDTTLNVCQPDTELCFYVFAEDPLGGPVVIEEILNPGFYEPETGRFCFNPAEICFDHPETIDTTICVIFRATGACGQVTDSLCIAVVSNRPPQVELPADTTIGVCNLGLICAGPALITDPDGDELTITGLGASYQDGLLCFEADSVGVYVVGVVVTDTCGHEVEETMQVTVRLNLPPEFAFADTVRAAVCGAEIVCFSPLYVSDPENDPVTFTLVEGPGTINPLLGEVCFEPEVGATYRFVVAAGDSCGSRVDTVWAEVSVNQPPVWVEVPDTSLRLCAPGDSVCFSVLASDPDGDPLIYAQPVEQCFLPDTAGLYLFGVEAADSCNAPIYDTARFAVTFNADPELLFSYPDTTLYICHPDTVICFGVGALDPDGDAVTLREILNPGTFDVETGVVCFNPSEICFGDPFTTDTTICLIFGASDACGPEVVDSLCLTLVRNQAPVVTLPADLEETLCGPDQICVEGVTLTDPEQDNLEVSVSDFAQYADGILCFDADTTGTYELVLCATDPCGLSDCDTILVSVTFNSAPRVLLPGDFGEVLCGPGEICFTPLEISDAEGDPLTISVTGAELRGDEVCLDVTTTGTYTVIVAATDSCGHTGADTIAINVQMNHAPNVMLRNPDPLTLCGPDTTLCYTVMVSDMDGPEGITLSLVKTNPACWSLVGNQLCLDVAAAHDNKDSCELTAIVQAQDSCGAIGRDTLTVTLQLNSPPTVNLPEDTTVVLCAPADVCIYPVTYSDPDGEQLTIEVTGGTLSGDSICNFFARDTSVWITLMAQDSCGLEATDSMLLTVEVNQAPVLLLPDVSSLELCAFDTVCIDGIEGNDPDVGRVPAELIAGTGTFDPALGRLCFVPVEDGVYEFTFVASDECTADTGTLSVTVTANRPPVFGDSPDSAVFACLPGDTVCLPFLATDPDGDAVLYALVSGPGLIDTETGVVCFAPDAAGRYEFVVAAEDSCGNPVYDTGWADITLNQAPTLSFSSPDTAIFLCDTDTEICFVVTATDPDGETPTIREIRNPGFFNPETGAFCFNPDSLCECDSTQTDTTICFVFAATDACGAETIDSLCVDLSRNLPPVVSLGADTSLSICQPETFCLDLAGRVTDLNDNVQQITVLPPAYSQGEGIACIDLDTSGTYSLVVCATDACGAEACDTLLIDVTLNTPPVVVLPPDSTVIACAVDTVCIGPVVISDADPDDSVTISITGDATLNGDQLCFAPLQGDGAYQFVVTVTDLCGAQDADTVTVTVDLNDPPVLLFSAPDTSIAVCNSDTEICFVVTAADPDGDVPLIEEVLVPGFFDPSTGAFCINPDSVCFDAGRTTDTTICVVFRATDACGATTVDSLCIEVVLNKPPLVHFSSPDTALFLCQPDTMLCFDVWGSDPEGDAVIISEVKNPGAYYPELGQFCFNPDSICFSGAAYDTTFCVIFRATDACGNSTVDSLCLELSANHPPVVEAPDTTDAIICALGDEVCVGPIFGQDEEDGIVAVSAPGATYDALLRNLCFTADTVGSYVITVTATDSCGATGARDILVRVVLNQPPQVTLPDDTTLFVCGPDTVCLDVIISDLEGAVAIDQITGPAFYDTSLAQLCVEVIAAGEPFTISVTVRDECGATATDEIVVTPASNRPPVLTLPADFAAKACAGDYCFGPVDISDPDGNFAGQVDVIGGIYDPDSARICITPDTPGVYTIVATATDECGATGSDTIEVTLTVNRPPVTSFSVPDTTLYLCEPDSLLCFTFQASDPDGDLVVLNEILNPGVFDPVTGGFCFRTSEICFCDPTTFDSTVCLIFAATDDCGATTYDTLCLEITANAPPTVVAPADTNVSLCAPDSICLAPFAISDVNGSKDSLQVSVTGPQHLFDPASGQICFWGDPGTYTFVVTATDRCGAVDQDSVQVTVTENQAPQVTLPDDFAYLICTDSLVCFAVSASDPDLGDSLAVNIVEGPGAYDDATGEICFTAAGAGDVRIVVAVTDLCGASAQDTVVVTVTENAPPTWTLLPQIDTFFCAVTEPFCFTVHATDPEGQSVDYTLVEGPGAIDSTSGEICFTPNPVTTTYTFVVEVTDICGASVLDTASATIRVNEPPSVTPPADTTDAQCVAAQFCFPPIQATDPDGEPVTLELLTGPGALNNNVLCFFPDTLGAAIYCFTLRGVDSCGLADTVNFCAQIIVNRPPVVTVPADFTRALCDSQQICFAGVTASDPDGTPPVLTKVSGPGILNVSTGELCFDPAILNQDYTFVFSAVDACGIEDRDSVTVTVVLNEPPTLDLPRTVANCLDSAICFDVRGSDPNTGDRVTIEQISGPPGILTPDPLVGATPLVGEWCWTPAAVGDYTAVFQITDSCGAVAIDTAFIRVEQFCDTLCFASEISFACPDSVDPNQWLFQGRPAMFSVTTTLSRPMGAFDFLIGFDASALSLTRVDKGDGISAWEFFTYRVVDPALDCTGPCPSGLVRIVGIADINNGMPLSDSTQMLPGVDPREFAQIVFQVSNDRTLAGQFIPVQFWWNDCGDNSFSSPDGALYVANTILPDSCIEEAGKELIEACATFVDGGGCIPRASDIDDRGDLNLNGLPYEIADAVLYANYFIYGASVFDPDPILLESQIAASDINFDGSPLTVADLVFLIRIILGLEDPIDEGGIAAKITPSGHGEVTWYAGRNGTRLELEATEPVGAVALDLEISGEIKDIVRSAALQEAKMDLFWHQEDAHLKVLVYSQEGASLPDGSMELFTLPAGVSLSSVDADLSTARGAVMSAKSQAGTVRPEAYSLAQNYPNPFNPETEIRFALSQASTVSLVIYNLLGQPVATLVDQQPLAAGEYRYKWSARDRHGNEMPSGVYMYRLRADDFVDTKKMMLVR